MRNLTLIVIAAAMLLAVARPARADIVAGYLQGQGGLSSNDASNRVSSSSSSSGSGLTPGLGFQVGARLLFLEGYYDRTAFGSGASVSRGILGVHAGFGAGDLRLVLRGGGGVLFEHGGVISGSVVGGDRHGVVARGGVALEKRLTRGELIAGVGLDGELFSVQASGASMTDRTQGGDLFLSLHLRFELGI